jgi:molecular chaperone HscA
MLQESMQKAEEDKIIRTLSEARVEAQSLMQAIAHAMRTDPQLLSPLEQENISLAMQALEHRISEEDPHAIRDATAALDKTSSDFAARRMNQAVRTALAGQHIDALDTQEHSS